MPDPVSGIFIPGIGLIFTVGKLMFFQIILNFLPVYSKKRTDHISIDRPDPGKPPDSGSSCQIQKHRLCIIVLMMRKRDLGPPITARTSSNAVLRTRRPASSTDSFFCAAISFTFS
mgnify:CR=1 FL=1